MYNHKEIEKKWQNFWEKNKTYKINNDFKKPKYYCLDMFPYPSWAWLHVWHPEWYTANDIVARYKNAKWFNVLHPMWWDAFWLPAENYAIKTWTHPRVTTDENIKNFKKQIKSLWFSYDWDREIDTTDPGYYKWTQWIFIKLFEKGLAYEQDLPINYCPSCKTGLANEEVLNDFTCERCGTKVEKKKIRQWVLAITKYAEKLLKDVDKLDWPESIKDMQRNWIGKSEGCEFEMKKYNDKNKSIRVYTTRIDTVFGMTYAVLAPDHKDIMDFISPKEEKSCLKYIENSKKKSDQDRTADNKEKTWVFTWSYVINPFNNKEVPLWIWDYVLWNYWTWAVMAVPAHDERDFEFAKKYSLDLKTSILPKGDNKEIKERILNFEECFTQYWVLINSGEFDWLTSEEAKIKLTSFAEKNWFWEKKINYKLRDWLFSRQRYWWEPIPLIHVSNEDIKKLPHISEEDFKEFQNKIENLINKKMRDAPLQAKSGTHNGTSANLSSNVIILKNIKKVKKKNHKNFKLKLFCENIVINWKTVRIQWRYLVNHFNEKIWFDRNKRLEFSRTIIENLDKVYFLSDTFWLIDINWKIWVVINEKIQEDIFDLVTFYPFKSLNDIFKNTFIVDQKAIKYLFLNREKIKIYDGIYSKIICDYRLPLELPQVQDYAPSWDGSSPLSKIENFVNIKLADNLSGKREANTMPQWWWSCWYYLRFMDPKNNENLVDSEVEKYWGQVDSYVGWAEHAVLHLLYARFWHKFLYDIWVVSSDEPFYRLRNQGLILSHAFERKNWWLVACDLVEEKNWKYYEKKTWEELNKIVSKMSKSLKNVVNPDDIIEEHWADSLRLYEMYMADFKDSAPRDAKWIIWVRRFLEKSERLFTPEAKISSESDENTKKLLHKTIKKVSLDIENYKFNTAIAQMMILVNNWLPKDEKFKKEWKQKFLVILHPFAPHLAEELWERYNSNTKWNQSIFFESWPDYDEKLVVDDIIKIWVQVLWKLRWEIEIWIEERKESVLEKAKNEENVKKWIDWKEILKEIYVPGKIVNLVIKNTEVKKEKYINNNKIMENSKKINYEKTGYKFVAVLNKKLEIGRIMNALAHMTAWMVWKSDDIEKMWIINYQDKDNSPHYASKHPFIILKAKNSNQIKNIRAQVIEKWLEFSSFTSAMIAWSYQEQLEESKKQSAEELEYFGLSIFWKSSDVDEITKKLSLWI